MKVHPNSKAFALINLQTPKDDYLLISGNVLHF